MSDKREQLAKQCDVVAHLASVIAKVHADKAECIRAGAGDDGFVNFVGDETAGFMEILGDILSGMDAVTEEDEWTAPVFAEAQRLWPQARP